MNMTGGEHPSPIVYTYSAVNPVKPLRKTPHVEFIEPNPADMMVMDCFVPIFFAYRLGDKANKVYKQLIERMKSSLRQVLIPFFPWAGRWTDVPWRKGRVLLCNDKGVPFIEASVEQELDSVLRFSAEFQPVLELQGYHIVGLNATKLRQDVPGDGLPCVFVQVTRFKCGGLVVAVTFNHMIADAKSFFDFMSAWSDFSRTNETNMICDHNRKPGDTLPGPLLDKTMTLAYVPPPNWEVKAYEVSKSVISSLKEEVQRDEGAYVSTMDCICAHMWKTLSSLSVIGGKEIAMMNFVEGRTRFYHPPLPNLLGNFVVGARASSIPTAEILNMQTSLIARKIRQKLVTTSRDTWFSSKRAMESLDTFTNDEVLPWQQTCWNSFPFYEMDFGFGNPFFSPGFNSNFSWSSFGLTYVGPPTPGVCCSAAFVVIQSTPQILEALERHPDFLPFFLPKRN